MPIRSFELPRGSAREQGRAHGEAFRGEIGTLVELRTYLTRTVGDFPSDEAVLECAAEHVPVLEAFDRDLHDELVGIAEGANLSPSAIVVLNHYTDLRDLGRRHVAVPDGCSMLHARSAKGPIAAQTWDMHASAMPFVMMLRVPADDRQPGAWMLSLTGCLGMAGVNDDRVAVLINNLTSTDAVVGVVWSALVRRAVRERSAAAAYRVIESAQVGSGHHYLVCDEHEALALETSGTRKRQTLRADQRETYVHTNHCLDADIAACTTVPGTSTTHARFDWLAESVRAKPVADLDDAWERLGSADGYPRSVCTMMADSERPHAPATCGALAVNLATGELRAVAGLTHRVRGDRFRAGEGIDA